MRYSKIIILLVFALTLVALSGVYALGQSVTINPAGPLRYHEFQVADLGLQGPGRGTRDFTIRITAGGGGDQAVTVEVRDDLTNDLLVTGDTDPFPQTTLQGTWFMGQLDDKFGGDFTVEKQAENLYDKVLATGLLPRGRYRITVGLSPAGASATLIVEIVPPYVQPLYPVDMQTNRAVLSFKWVSNIERQELHVYTDAAGNREVLGGSRLPFTKIGGALDMPKSQNVPGSVVAPVLEDGTRYYWQIHGYVVTSHGEERRKGVLTAFQYFENKEDIGYIGLTDPDKKAIMDELIKMLQAVMGKEKGDSAAQKLKGYRVSTVSKDKSPVSREEIISILQEIIAGRATATAISFQ